jgi:hypothetical protein
LLKLCINNAAADDDDRQEAAEARSSGACVQPKTITNRFRKYQASIEMKATTKSAGFVLAVFMLNLCPSSRAETVIFFDDFPGPNLSSTWEAAFSASPDYDGASHYIGPPAFEFQSFNDKSYLKINSDLSDAQRRGWMTQTNFSPWDFRCELRFRTLDAATCVDGFMVLSIHDAVNSNRFDSVYLFGGSYGADPLFRVVSTIEPVAEQRSFAYASNKDYRLVLEGGRGRNVRALLLSDAGEELMRQDLSHDAYAFRDGFKIGISQQTRSPGHSVSLGAAIDSVRLTCPEHFEDLVRVAAYLGNLPIPDQDPSGWQWSAQDYAQVLQILGSSAPLHTHRPGSVRPSALVYPGATNGPAPGVGTGYGGVLYLNWNTGLRHMPDLSMDVTFHTPPIPAGAVYLQLYDFPMVVPSTDIKVGQYFGFQYWFDDQQKLQTQFIWSRWNSTNKSDAWVADGGWIEAASYENDFVGIRYPYRWTAGTYTVHLAMRRIDEVGAWYDMQVYDHQMSQWKKIGGLRFPRTASGLPLLENNGGSWVEVFGGTTSSQDLGLMHYSFGGVYACGRRIRAKSVNVVYDERTPNSNVAINPDGRRVHVVYGGQTARTDPPGEHLLKPEPTLLIWEQRPHTVAPLGFYFEGTGAETYSVEASSNLREWTTAGVLPASNSSICHFTCPTPFANHLFFRTASP